jgi:hypothetical protein
MGAFELAFTAGRKGPRISSSDRTMCRTCGVKKLNHRHGSLDGERASAELSVHRVIAALLEPRAQTLG